MVWRSLTTWNPTLSALLVTLAALGFAASPAAAQNACTKDEVFGGYSWLAPNGWGDLDYKINNIPNAFDASNTWYLPNAHNFGIVLDGSGHFNGGTTPPNLQNGSNNSTSVGYGLGGVQYKWHNEKLSPFVRGFVGAANISPDCCHGTEWSFAAGGGGGLDLNLTPRFSVRMIQADYIYSSYSHVFPSTHSTEWNSVRLAAGVVINFGNYCNEAPIACTISAASPTEVWTGEPVKFSTAASGLNPKHTASYGWKSAGGNLSGANTASSTIDTTNLAPGSYAVTATVTDPKMKTGNVATCAAVFLVKTPAPKPVGPTVKCIPPETMIKPGESATVRMDVTNPDNRPLTYAWTSSSGQVAGSGDSATVTPSNNDAGGTITVTGKVNDNLGLSDSCQIMVTVPKFPPPCVKLLDWGECTFEKDPKRPWRVDNDCKDVLDKVALQLQGASGGKLAIVGYSDAHETSKTLAAQRSENAKYYLVTDGSNKVDGSRVQARQGGARSRSVHFYFVPDGVVCSGEPDLGSPVDEAKVRGQSRTTPAQAKKAAAPASPKQ
jgi:hypothetical protein